jgi:hypothetical protein
MWKPVFLKNQFLAPIAAGAGGWGKNERSLDEDLFSLHSPKSSLTIFPSVCRHPKRHRRRVLGCD